MTEINADQLLRLAGDGGGGGGPVADPLPAPVAEPAAVPRPDLQPDVPAEAEASSSSKQNKKKRVIDPINHERDDRATKIRKAEQWGAHPVINKSPLAAASVGQQNRSKRIVDAYIREKQQAGQLYLKSKHDRPGVPLPGVVSSLLRQTEERGMAMGGEGILPVAIPGAAVPGGGGTAAANGAARPSRPGRSEQPAAPPGAGRPTKIDPETVAIDKEFRSTVSRAVVRASTKALRLPEEETCGSPGLHLLVERNLRWFDGAHDLFKLAALIAAKKLNALAEEAIKVMEAKQ